MSFQTLFLGFSFHLHFLVSAFPLNMRFPRRTAKRVVSFADFHGDFDIAKKAFIQAKIIDPITLNWIAEPDTVVIQEGDIVDRGNQAREIYDFLFRLQDEARAIARERNSRMNPSDEYDGSELILLFGNHEAMRMNVREDVQLFMMKNAINYMGVHESSWLRDRPTPQTGPGSYDQKEIEKMDQQVSADLDQIVENVKVQFQTDPAFLALNPGEERDALEEKLSNLRQDEYLERHSREGFYRAWNDAWRPGQWLRTEIENRFRVFCVVNGVLYVHASFLWLHAKQLIRIVRQDIHPVIKEITRSEREVKDKVEGNRDRGDSSTSQKKNRNTRLKYRAFVEKLIEVNRIPLKSLNFDSVYPTSRWMSSKLGPMSEDLRDLAFAVFFEKVKEQLADDSENNEEEMISSSEEEIVSSFGILKSFVTKVIAWMPGRTPDEVDQMVAQDNDFLDERDSPFWTRDHQKTCQDIKKIFTLLNVYSKTMIVGHTIQNDGRITPMCDQKIIFADTAMSQAYRTDVPSGQMSGLIMANLPTGINKALTALYLDKEEVLKKIM